MSADDITNASEGASGDMQAQAGNTTQSCPAVTINIGVFFDGTGNNISNVESDPYLRGQSYENDLSNVALLTSLYRDGDAFDEMNACGSVGTKYASLYVQGIGTRAQWPDWYPGNIVGAATGLGLTGVESRVYSALREIDRIVDRLSPREEPEEIILDVFGFSRGAASARYFVNCFKQGYIMYWMYYVVPKYAWLPSDRNIRIRFIGIFDTVAAIGDAEDDDNGAVNVHLKTSQADAIHHLTAKHEYRTNFRLNHNLPGGGDHTVMLGAHSDVGGGYRDEGDTTRVAPADTRVFFDRASAEAAHAADTAAAAAARNAEESFWVQDGWILPNDPRGGLNNAPSPVRRVVVSDGRGGTYERFTYTTGAILDRPWVQPGLNRIPLRFMYDKAKDAGVPFLAFPSSEKYVIPPALAELAGGMERSGAMPSAANQRAILNQFGHVSSNLDSIGMAPQLGTGDQRLWHRTIYDNDTSQAK